MRRVLSRSLSSRVLWSALCCSAGLFAWTGCRKTDVPARLPEAPSVRLYFISSLAGALEPCGCRKDMLGGIDHTAALLASRATEAPRHLLLAAGPLFFQNPTPDADRGEQDQWKAEALAAALGELHLAAWSPGVNDFAHGNPALLSLTRATGARLLAANLAAASTLPVVGTALFEVGDYRVGVAGIGAAPADIDADNDRARALAAAAQQLDAAGAQIRVALISGTRGDGLRLAEKVTGFDVIALGKASDEGDANDAPFPPTLVGETLVVQAPNHLQALAYVDLFVVGNSFAFDDGSGIALGERRESLNNRQQELARRKERWAAAAAPDPRQGQELESELTRLRTQSEALAHESTGAAKARGSSFRYQLVEVREAAGSDPKIVSLMSQYYRRVNEHNREAFRDRVPPPAPAGASAYVGQAVCASCHAEEDAFWHGTGHARAYKTLSDQYKEFNLDCVGCHVTGYNRPGGSTVTHMQTLQNVQCEACHGAGSRHAESSGDTNLITLSPDPNVCRGCHQTPHVAEDWNAQDAWQHIIGPGHGQAAGVKGKP
jgi:hypothetical protein